MSTSAISPLTLSGTSKYTSDFQNILNRAVAIAQLPVTALQNRQADLLQQKTLLSGLSSAAAALSASVTNLGAVAARQAVSASSSNPAAVSVASSGATSAANYTINSITSIASAASERTQTSFGDATSTPVSSTGSVDLKVGSNTYSLTLGSGKNNLVGLRDAINTSGAGVTASILTTAGGNYLTISANATGATTLELRDDPGGANTNLLTNSNQGSNANFKLNGIDVSQSGNVVNSVIPGLTFNILATSSTPVALTLATDSSQLSSALQDFTNNYNALKSVLTAQQGAGAGLLSGDSNVRGLQQTLRQLGGYNSGSGTVSSLAQLGVTFDSTGAATFDPKVVSAFTGTQVSDAFKYLGSTSTGLGQFAQNLSQYSDPFSGLIHIAQNGIDATDRSITSQVSLQTDRINAMQAALLQQLAKADSLQAQLASQQSTLTASLTSLNYTLYGKPAGS